MFGTIDHVTGAARVRIRRFYLKTKNKPPVCLKPLYTSKRVPLYRSPEPSINRAC